MRRIITYTAALLLTLTYLLSYIGFGVHTCSCSGSTQIILLFNNLSCEKIHAHIHLAGDREHHHECSHSHSDGCCHTDILMLTDAQDDSRQTSFINISYKMLSDCILPDTINALPHSGICPYLFTDIEPPVPDITGADRTILSVWRL